MTILTNNYKNYYNEGILSRTVGNKLCRIDLKGTDSIKQLDRLSQLDNESFELMSDIQRRQRHANS